MFDGCLLRLLLRTIPTFSYSLFSPYATAAASRIIGQDLWHLSRKQYAELALVEAHLSMFSNLKVTSRPTASCKLATDYGNVN